MQLFALIALLLFLSLADDNHTSANRLNKFVFCAHRVQVVTFSLSWARCRHCVSGLTKLWQRSTQLSVIRHQRRRLLLLLMGIDCQTVRGRWWKWLSASCQQLSASSALQSLNTHELVNFHFFLMPPVYRCTYLYAIHSPVVEQAN